MNSASNVSAFEKLKNEYVDMLTSLHEEKAFGEGREGSLLYQSRLLEAEACYRDLHWLKNNSGAYQLSDLSLAIAQELKPEEDWDFVETDEVHSVVSNSSRSMVFDFKLYDRLSAEESLVYAGDEALQGRPVRRDRLDAYLNEKEAKMTAVLEKLQALLGKGGEPDQMM